MILYTALVCAAFPLLVPLFLNAFAATTAFRRTLRALLG